MPINNKSRAWVKPIAPQPPTFRAVNPLRETLSRLMRRDSLGRDEAASFLNELIGERLTDAQISAALIALASKGETVEELAGMAAAMRSRSLRLQCRHERFIDTAGTGSSAVKTFNVSTAAAFVVAGAGLPVAKHGARAATSRTGSADVLSALGVQVAAAPDVSERCLNEIGICFMFAPLYHGATARVAGIRRELGVHTTFNLLGPLTNPAGAPGQMIGVWHPSLVESLARTLSMLGTKKSWVVHGSDGLDEITIAGKSTVAEASPEGIRSFELGPEDFGLRRRSLESLHCDDPETSAQTIRQILDGERRDKARDLVVINAAAGLFIGGIASELNEARYLAEESIDSGAAREKLKALVKATNE